MKTVTEFLNHCQQAIEKKQHEIIIENVDLQGMAPSMFYSILNTCFLPKFAIVVFAVDSAAELIAGMNLSWPKYVVVGNLREPGALDALNKQLNTCQGLHLHPDISPELIAKLDLSLVKHLSVGNLREPGALDALNKQLNTCQFLFLELHRTISSEVIAKLDLSLPKCVAVSNLSESGAPDALNKQLNTCQGLHLHPAISPELIAKLDLSLVKRLIVGNLLEPGAPAALDEKLKTYKGQIVHLMGRQPVHTLAFQPQLLSVSYQQLGRGVKRKTQPTTTREESELNPSKRQKEGEGTLVATSMQQGSILKKPTPVIPISDTPSSSSPPQQGDIPLQVKVEPVEEEEFNWHQLGNKKH